MKILNVTFTKECLYRALRTFLQTAIGYVITNISLYAAGVDFADGDVVKKALIGLAVSAISAGSAAVMNMKKGEDKNDG